MIIILHNFTRKLVKNMGIIFFFNFFNLGATTQVMEPRNNIERPCPGVED